MTYWTPRKGLNSWQHLIQDYLNGKFKRGQSFRFLKLVSSVINRTPQILHGDGAYTASVLKHGIDAPFAPHNVTRYRAHAYGGFFICTLSAFLAWIPLVTLMLVIGILELRAHQENIVKPSLDFVSWGMGGVMSTLSLYGRFSLWH